MEVYIEEVQVTFREARETTRVASHFCRWLLLRGLSGSRSPLCQVTSHCESSPSVPIPFSISGILSLGIISVGVGFSMSRVDSAREGT